MNSVDDTERNPQWHLLRGGKQYGPFSPRELLEMAKVGNLLADDLLWKPGYEAWKAASAIPGLLNPPAPPPRPVSAVTASSTQAERADQASGHARRSNVAPKGVKARLRFAADNFRRLWRGQQPLWEAFWLYWLAGGIASLFLAFMLVLLFGAALAKVGFNEATYDVVVGIVALPVAAAAVLYQFFAAVGAWRSASWREVAGILARVWILISMSVFSFKIGAIGYALLAR